jgi:hypothetical protein
VDFNHLMGNSATTADANKNRNPHKMVISPGYKNIFLNLASDLFMQPIGLMLYFKDSNNESVYAAYAENCVIPNHDLGMDAGGTVMQENVSIQFERLLPIWIADSISVTDIESANRISRPQNETGGYKFAHTSHNS